MSVKVDISVAGVEGVEMVEWLVAEELLESAVVFDTTGRLLLFSWP
jgi:hypothetical protein